VLIRRLPSSTKPLKVVLCDFGLSVILDGPSEEGCAASGRMLPLRWCAPEVFDPDQVRYSSASEAWAFAVCVWEMASRGEVPYPDLMTNVDVLEFIQSGERLDLAATTFGALGSECSAALCKLVKRCWALDVDTRPSLGELSSKLRKLASSASSELAVRFPGTASDSSVAREASSSSAETPEPDMNEVYQFRADPVYQSLYSATPSDVC
jgi:epidermal growth factor receptor